MNSIQPFNPGGPAANPNYTWNGNGSDQVWDLIDSSHVGCQNFRGRLMVCTWLYEKNGDDTR
jgi:hypothetical protein